MKPGMNAKVEIIVDQLADVLYVPVQSIEVEQDHHFCYISNNGNLERREISTGLFNDEFIEVRDGLQGGEAVALAIPKKAEADMGGSDKPEPESSPAKAKSSKPKEKAVAIAKP